MIPGIQRREQDVQQPKQNHVHPLRHVSGTARQRRTEMPLVDVIRLDFDRRHGDAPYVHGIAMHPVRHTELRHVSFYI